MGPYVWVVFRQTEDGKTWNKMKIRDRAKFWMAACFLFYENLENKFQRTQSLKIRHGRKEFLHYFKQKQLTSDTKNEKEIAVIKINISIFRMNAELSLVEEKIQKSAKLSAKYRKAVA